MRPLLSVPDATPRGWERHLCKKKKKIVAFHPILTYFESKLQYVKWHHKYLQ